MMKTAQCCMVMGLTMAVVLAGVPARSQDDDTASPKQIKLSGLVQQTKGGYIDWGGRMIYATGEAPLPDESQEPNRARALLKVKDYAKMLAIANLLMVIEGTPVSYEGNGKDFMDKDASLRQTIEGYVKNVEILKSETFDSPEGRKARVTVGTRMYGEATPGGALMEKLAATEKPKQPPLIQIPLEKSGPRPSVPAVEAEREESLALARRWSGPAASKPVDPDVIPHDFKQQGPFTSLVVDARGFNVPQALSPKLRKYNGDQVYGSALDKSDPALRDGLVAYARTPEDARQSERCGSNPMLVRAIGRGGGRSMCDVILADDVAGLVTRENATSKFFDRRAVIFVVDPLGSAVSSAVTQAKANN